MYVARSRQKPPENAFQIRSRLKAAQEAAEAEKAAPIAPVQEPFPTEAEAIALREAVARAAALVHGSEPEPDEDDTEETSMRGTSVTAVAVDEVESFTAATKEADGRGRPPSSTVAERTACVLELIVEAGSEGISKPALAEAVGTKEANVYTSLRKLQGAGQVETRQLPDKTYRWFAV